LYLTPLSTIFQLHRCGQMLMVEETGVPEERRCTKTGSNPHIGSMSECLLKEN